MMLSTPYPKSVPQVCIVVYFENVGAFLVPYLVFVVTCGVPLFLLETTVGQFTQEGSITCWRKLCPLAEGRALLQCFMMVTTVVMMCLNECHGKYFSCVTEHEAASICDRVMVKHCLCLIQFSFQTYKQNMNLYNKETLPQ